VTTAGARPRRRWRERPGTQLHHVEPSRTIASVSLLIVAALLFFAVGGSWWQAELVGANPSTDAQVQNVVITYRLGGFVDCSTWKWESAITPCANVSSSQGGVEGGFAMVANGALVGLLAATVFAWSLATLGNVGIRFGRRQLHAEIAIVLVVALVAGGLLIGGLAAGPGPQASGYCWILSGNVTGCSFFWGGTPAGQITGSCENCTSQLSWGAGLSYYETLGAFAVATGTGAALWLGRKRPYTHEEVEVWAQRFGPVAFLPRTDGPGGETARPGSSGPGYRVAETPWTCPNCHAANSQYALLCRECRTERPRG